MLKLKEKILLIAKVGYVVLSMTIVITACNDEEKISSIEDAVTLPFYVFSATPEEDEFSKHECGYLLFGDYGNPGHYHNRFVWTENLPKEYQEHILPVTVTFNYTEEKCGSYPIIDIIKIQKQ